LFAGIRSACLEQLPVSDPVLISIDDSLLPKTGPKIVGVAWRRDHPCQSRDSSRASLESLPWLLPFRCGKLPGFADVYLERFITDLTQLDTNPPASAMNAAQKGWLTVCR
jgi:hypothetical protein